LPCGIHQNWFSSWSGSLKMKRILKNYQELIAKVCLADLSKAIPILESCYASFTHGKVPPYPLTMLRSFFVMGLKGFVSIAKWVKALKSQPVLAVLCELFKTSYQAS
jgi:hypothetical protein